MIHGYLHDTSPEWSSDSEDKSDCFGVANSHDDGCETLCDDE